MKKTAKELADQLLSSEQEVKGNSLLRKAAPWLGATGAGALGYGLLRRGKFAPVGSQLRALQDVAKDRPFSVATSGGTPFAQRIRSLIFGAPTVRSGQEVRGTVLHHTPSPKGGGEVELNTGGIANAMHDKWTFDQIMREGIGTGAGLDGAVPNTMLLSDALKRVGGDPSKLKQLFPEFMLKAREGSMGRGIFKSLDDPGANEALQNSRQFIFQEKMPIKNEFRVHTVNNNPFTASHRFMPNKTLRSLWDRVAGGGGGAFVPLVGKKRQALQDFVRKSTAHLKPGEGKTLQDAGESFHAAWDVAELPDGTFKLIEANPVPGTLMNPVISQKLQRQITGRWSRPVAALGGITAAGTTGALTSALVPSKSNVQESPSL